MKEDALSSRSTIILSNDKSEELVGRRRHRNNEFIIQLYTRTCWRYDSTYNNNTSSTINSTRLCYCFKRSKKKPTRNLHVVPTPIRGVQKCLRLFFFSMSRMFRFVGGFSKTRLLELVLRRRALPFSI